MLVEVPEVQPDVDDRCLSSIVELDGEGQLVLNFWV
jgi:hypothetical protein